MTLPRSGSPAAFDDRVFLFLVAVVSLAFGWILWPFSGAILWGTALAIIFAPLFRRLVRSMRGRRTLAALATMLTILVIVILPLTVLTILLVRQAIGLYMRIQSGELDVGSYVQQVLDAMPNWVTDLVNRFGPTDVAGLQERLASVLTGVLRFLGNQALNLGQYTIGFILSLFVMLYLLFFLIRDGDGLARRIKAAIPLRPELREQLGARFTTVIRATIKGSLVVSVVQGALGGLFLWAIGIQAAILWGALMALFALLPVVGPAVIWIPIAVYLVASGSLWKGIALALFGIVVIGLVDNILRPMLVGKDTRMPDYIVLITTLGGIAVFGINGFIIGPVIAAMFISVWEIFAATRGARSS